MRLRAVVLVGALLVVLVLAVYAYGQWQTMKAEQEFAALRDRLSKEGGDAVSHNRLGLELADRGEEEEALAHLEIAVEEEPENLRYGNDLRTASIRFGRYDRPIAFFLRQTEANPGLPQPRLQLALAYIDKMPDHMLGIVGQGKLSKQSIAVLTEILSPGEAALDPPLAWSALFALGMNHLYWPKALGHAPASADAFEKCVDLQKSGIEGTHAYFVLPYLGLGDAYVKAGRHDDARRIWRESRELTGNDPRLEERLAISNNDALTEFVDKTRGLGIVVDTDLSVLWGRKP